MDKPTEQVIDVGFGKANLKRHLATWGAMHVQAPFKRETVLNAGSRLTGSYSAQPCTLRQEGGALINQKLRAKNGTIVLIQASWKHMGSPIRDAAMFIRLRDGGPTYRVRAKVPQDEYSICPNLFTVFQGEGDILGEAELKLLDLEVPRRYFTNFMQEDEIDECFEIEQFAPERIARPQLTAVATSEGIKTLEMAPTPARRLRLGRRPLE